MALRVTRVRKGNHDDIVGMSGHGWTHDKTQVLENIRNHLHEYYVSVHGEDRPVHIGVRNAQDYLTTGPDGSTPNDLDNLPHY